MVRNYIDVAQLTSTIGLDGRFAIDISANLSFLLHEGLEMWLVPPQIDAPRCVHVKDVDERNHAHMVSFKEIEHVSIAEKLLGCHCLLIETDEIAAAVDEVMAHDVSSIIGWSFLDAVSGVNGIIADVYDNVGQLMLEVDHDGRISLVPYVEDLIADVDDMAKKITMQCPLGLFDLSS